MKTLALALMLCTLAGSVWADAPPPTPDAQVAQQQVSELQALVQVLKQQRDQANDQSAVAIMQLQMQTLKSQPPSSSTTR